MLQHLNKHCSLMDTEIDLPDKSALQDIDLYSVVYQGLPIPAVYKQKLL